MMGQELIDQTQNEEVVDLADDVDELDRERTEEVGEESADAGDPSAEGEEEGADGEEEAGAKESEEEAESSEEDLTKAEITSLRQMVRAQRNQLKEIEGQLKKQNEALVDKDIIAEDEIVPEVAAAEAQRSELLGQMVELMELNPKFEDVKGVCSQANFDDVTESLAKAYTAEHGGDENDVAEQIAKAVWAKTNPYKEMYSLIKQYHPSYAASKAKAKSPAKDPLEDSKKAKNKGAAPSLSNMTGGGGSKTGGSGWTSARIDQLSEAELDNVPADVYDKYMRGTLD